MMCLPPLKVRKCFCKPALFDHITLKFQEIDMEKIYTENAPEAIGPYSQAIKVGNLLFTSGQIAIDPATSTVNSNDIYIC